MMIFFSVQTEILGTNVPWQQDINQIDWIFALALGVFETPPTHSMEPMLLAHRRSVTLPTAPSIEMEVGMTHSGYDIIKTHI